MENTTPRMLTVKDIMERLAVSKSTAYTIMRDVNDDLEAKGLRTIPGRISQKHFDAMYFGTEDGE